MQNPAICVKYWVSRYLLYALFSMGVDVSMLDLNGFCLLYDLEERTAICVAEAWFPASEQDFMAL